MHGLSCFDVYLLGFAAPADLSVNDLLDIINNRGEELKALGNGGVVYIRWGNTTCPDGINTQLLYSGLAGKSSYNQQGGGNNFQCFPEEPEYSDYRAGVQGYVYAYGAEYEYPIPQLGNGVLHDDNVPCAVCYSPVRIALVMIPAKLTCPHGWTREYHGYLMSGHLNQHSSTFECVDHNAEAVPGSQSNVNGALLYHVEADCSGLPCEPYLPEKELTCVVCTK